MLKNIVFNSTIEADGDIHIGDKIYILHEDFKESILFLQIEELVDNRYYAQFFIKSPHSEDLELRTTGKSLFLKKIELNIFKSLFQQIEDFRENRRGANQVLRRTGSTKQEVSLREQKLAKLIYDTFFTGDIGTVAKTFIRLLQNSKISELSLVISSKNADIRNIPWEIVTDYLFNQALNYPQPTLANSKFSLVRTTETNLKAFKLKGANAITSPLKLLFITALPENLPERSKMLQIEDEQKKLIEAIGNYEATGDGKPKIVIEFLDNASISEIVSALENRRHDILHISGHGAYLEDVKKGVLYLENEDGDEQLVSGKELGKAIHYHKNLKLLVLSACETAVAGEAGTVEQLARTGVPAILGMRFAVTDEGAKRFTNTFYGSLSEGQTLTTALADGRQELYKHVNEKREKYPEENHDAEWFTPVMYLNQMVGALVSKIEYDYDIKNNFYPQRNIIPGKHSRFIGEGFIGRKRDLIQLRQSFDNNIHVCIQGLGGFGKTTLAEAFARSYKQRNGHEIILWRGKSEINELVILQRLLDSLANKNVDVNYYKRLKNDIENPQKNIFQKIDNLIYGYLKGKKFIFIFDNFEDLQEHKGGGHPIKDEGLCNFLRHFVSEMPEGCHVIFTTRYSITNLNDQIKTLRLNRMSYAEQYRYVSFSKHLNNMPYAERERLFHRVQGHPRSLEYLESLAKKGYLKSWTKLDENLDEVSADIFENLLLQEIYTLISPDEKLIFQRIVTLGGRVGVHVLKSISGFNEAFFSKVTSSLQDYSLVYLDDESKTIQVHSLVVEWANRKKMIIKSDRKKWSLEAGRFCEKSDELSDKMLAIQYYEIAEEWGALCQITFFLNNYLLRVGLYSLAEKINRKILNIPQIEDEKRYAFNNLGRIASVRDDDDSSYSYFNSSLDIARRISDIEGMAASLTNIGQIYIKNNNIPEAMKYCEEALFYWEKTSNEQGKVSVLNNLASIAHGQGKLEKAHKLYSYVLDVSEKNEESAGFCTALGNIGLVYLEQKNFTKAEEYLSASLEKTIEIDFFEGKGAALINMCHYYFAIKKYDNSLDYANQALDFLDESGGIRNKKTIFEKMALIFEEKEDYEQAIRYYKKSLSINEELNEQIACGNIMNKISVIYAVAEDEINLTKYATATQEFCEKIEYWEGLVMSLTDLAVYYTNHDKVGESVVIFEKALSLQEEYHLEDESSILHILTHLSIAYFMEKEFNRAIPLGERMVRISKKLGSESSLENSLSWLGNFYLKSDEFQKAIDSWGALLKRLNSRKTSLFRAAIKSNIGVAYSKKEQFKEAIIFLDASIVEFAGLEANFEMQMYELLAIRDKMGESEFDIFFEYVTQKHKG